MDACQLKRPAYLLLRDDDAYDADAGFTEVFELCLRERVPVTYCAIPSKLTKSLVGLFLDHGKLRDLFDITQHGWSHANHNKTSRRPRYEFGPSRSYAAQKGDMARGLKRMRAALGSLFTPAFVPPFHYYDANTLLAAQSLGYRIFSAGPQKFSIAKAGFLYLHAQLSVNEYDDAYRSLPLSLPRLIRETARLINEGRIVGVYFHHSTLDPRNLGVFKEYLRFLKRLAVAGWIRSLTFSAYEDARDQGLPGPKTICAPRGARRP